MRQAVLLCIFFILSYPLLAQSNKGEAKDSLKTITLESVTIVKQILDLSQQGLNAKSLQNGVQTNLSNALDHIPGLFKIHEAGFPLVYRGMSGNRLRIERNGALRTGVVQQGYLTDDVNPGTVGSIKVIRGIESTLFGSGSIGGVIQLNELPFPQLKAGGSVYLANGTNNQSRTLGLDYTRKGDFAGIRLTGRINSTGNFQFGNGETAENSAQEQKSLNASFFRRNKTKTHQLTWGHSYSDSDIERPQGFQNNPFELRNYRNRFTYQTNLESQAILKNGAVLKQNLWALWLETDQQLSSFNGDFSQLNVSENRNYQKQAFGYRGKLALQPSKTLSLQVGADFTGSWLDQNNIRQDFLNQILDENTFTQSRIEQMGGFFGLAEFKLNKAILGFALRADLASIGTRAQKEQYQALTGGVELTFDIKEHQKQVVSLTRKFRYPSQQESVGVLFGGRGTFFGNPDLKPEYGYQLEYTMIRKLNTFMDISVSSWFALFENRIAEFFLGNNEFTYRNLNQARTMGLETRIDYRLPGGTLENTTILSLSGTITQGDELNDEGIFSTGTPLTGIPPARLRLSIQKTRLISKDFRLAASANVDYVLAYDRLPSGPIRQTFGVMETEGYWLADLNLTATWKLDKNAIEFGFNLTNLTDTAYFPFGARLMGMGRNLTGFLRYSF